MRNRYNNEDEHDYSPNELAELLIRNKDKYDSIVIKFRRRRFYF